ncbi:MAG: NlpC/P60 family protein [Christensenellales bacterium]
MGQSELQPGDLVFWQNCGCSGYGRWDEIHHVGIYIGYGKVVEASSGKGRIAVRELWSTPRVSALCFRASICIVEAGIMRRI